MAHELDPGDYLYQSDQELFLVCIGETDNSYQFAVHGWRDIDKERVEEYVAHDSGKLHKQSDITDVVEEKGSDEQKEHFAMLRAMFQAYADVDLPEEGPHTEFALEDG